VRIPAEVDCGEAREVFHGFLHRKALLRPRLSRRGRPHCREARLASHSSSPSPSRPAEPVAFCLVPEADSLRA
jgi:hypothetical protein